MGGCLFFNTLHFNHIYSLCVSGGGAGGVSQVPFITFWIFSLLSQLCKILIQVFIIIKPGIICTFPIHSGSLQNMLTALFNLVLNAQKSKWTIFLSAKARCFLVLKKRQLTTNLKCFSLLFFSTFLKSRCHIFIQL